MLSNVIQSEQPRNALIEAAAKFYAHPHNRADDTYAKHQLKLSPGVCCTALIKHSSGVLLIEKTHAGAISAIGNVNGDDYSAMMAIGLAQLEEVLPTPVKKVRKPRKTVAERKAEKTAQADLGGLTVKPASKPRKKKAKE